MREFKMKRKEPILYENAFPQVSGEVIWSGSIIDQEKILSEMNEDNIILLMRVVTK